MYVLSEVCWRPVAIMTKASTQIRMTIVSSHGWTLKISPLHQCVSIRRRSKIPYEMAIALGLCGLLMIAAKITPMPVLLAGVTPVLWLLMRREDWREMVRVNMDTGDTAVRCDGRLLGGGGGLKMTDFVIQSAEEGRYEVGIHYLGSFDIIWVASTESEARIIPILLTSGSMARLTYLLFDALVTNEESLTVRH